MAAEDTVSSKSRERAHTDGNCESSKSQPMSDTVTDTEGFRIFLRKPWPWGMSATNRPLKKNPDITVRIVFGGDAALEKVR